MILDVDIGNSNLKWRLDGGAVSATAADDLEPLADHLAQLDVTRVRASCVAGQKVKEKFACWCRKHLGVEPEYASVIQYHRGIVVAYEQPSSLGVDRWLAMLAAYHQVKGACAIVDAGSALTVDVVDKSGTHLGGLILPGVRLMTDALFTRTHAVKVGPLTLPQKWQLGCDTVSCVENAMAAAFTGLVHEVVSYGENRCGDGLVFLACGGDAEAIACRDPRFEVHPNLVLDGLPLALGDS